MAWQGARNLPDEGEEDTGLRVLRQFYTAPFVYRGTVWTEPTVTKDTLRKCETFRFREQDVLICSLPGTGNTVTQEMVYQIINHKYVERKVNFGPMDERSWFLEYNEFPDEEDQNPVDYLHTKNSPRIMKTHLPLTYIVEELDEVDPRIIVVMRNPKDVVVSSYSLLQGYRELKKVVSFTDFFQLYMSDKMLNGRFCDFYLPYWAMREMNNVLILRFEDIVRQPYQEVRRISGFLGYNLSEPILSSIAYNTSFDMMSINYDIHFELSGSGTFFRKGKVGEWKNVLTVAQNEAMDKWIAERLEPEGLMFQFE